MFDTCISSITNQQLLVLKEILLRFPFMLQMYQALEEEIFYQILSKINYKAVNKNQDLSLDSKSFYLFFGSGYIYKKGKQDKVQKTIRIKTKTKFFTHNRINKSSRELRQSRSYQIQQFQHFEDTSDCSNNIRPNQSYYCPYKKSLVLYCSFQQLPQDIASKIKDLHMEKFKFLHSFPIFKSIQKNILEEHLYKFHYNLFTFKTIWHKQANHQVLFVKQGSIQITYSNGLFMPYVIDGKCFIGFNEPSDVSAKVISQNVHCFIIQQANIHNILSKSNLCKIQPLVQVDRYANSGPIVTPTNQLPQIPQDVLSASFRATTSLKKRPNHRSQGQLDLLLKRQRRINLRKHFSNFYNEIFEQFSQKKVRHMGLDINSDDKLVLYQIKLLQKKSPNMDQINNRLKKIRLQKMKKCKIAIQGHHHLKQLKNVGITIL